MSEITVEAVQPVLGLQVGDVVTVERTRRVDAAVAAGRLLTVGAAPVDVVPVEAAPTVEVSEERADVAPEVDDTPAKTARRAPRKD